MKSSKLTSLLAITLSFELLVGPLVPLAMAEEPPKPAKERKTGPGAAEYINFGLQTAGQVLNQVRGQSSMTPQMAGDMYHLEQQRTPQPDKYFSAQKLGMIPGLGKYLALNNLNPAMLDCKTLPTTLHDMKPEVCRVGITGDKGDPNMQMQQAFTYYNQYFQTQKMYENFSASSNSDGQLFGVGCMQNAMNILNGFFKYRTDELDKLVTNLEALNNQFKEASRADLDAIKEGLAVLEGGDSPLTSELRSKRPDLFDFKKRFDNPACNSMFEGESINDLGRKTGLNSIARTLQDTLGTKAGGYSGASYSQSHAAVVKDIESVADKMGKQLEINFTSAASGGDKGYLDLLRSLNSTVSSSTKVAASITPDTFADLQTKFLESNLKLNEAKNDILSAHPGSGNVLKYLGQTSAGNFEAEVGKLENSMKNECLASSIDADTLLSKIYDPSSSKFANEHASNFLKDKLTQILGDDQTSIERKVAELKTIESQQGDRYIVRMNNAYEVQELDANGNIVSRIVEASNRKSPSSYLSDIVKNCNAQFKANKSKGGNLTGAQVIQKLRQVNQDFKKLAQAQAQGVKTEVRKKLIECESPEIANNTVAGSCNSDLFNVTKPGFCANAAFSCSKNMQACTKQAENFTKEIKAQKTARTNNYKALLEKNKNDVVKMFDTTLAQYMKEGESLRGIFGAGFASPADIRRQIDDNDPKKHLADVKAVTASSDDGMLLLENPDAYIQMFKENIALLKDSVTKQQEQILGGAAVGENSGLLAKHIEATKKNYDTVAKNASKAAEMCLAKHDGQIDKMEQSRAAAADAAMKAESELGEKLPFICSKFGTGSSNPNPNCNGNIDDLADAAMKAANRSYNRAEDQRIVGQWKTYCDMTMNHKDGGTGFKGNWSKICADKNSAFYSYDSCETIRKIAKGGLTEAEKKTYCATYVTVVVDRVSEQREGKPDCTRKMVETSEDLDKLHERNSVSNMTFPEGDINISMPSFCSAGHDGNRNTGKALMQGIQQGLQGINFGTIGQ